MRIRIRIDQYEMLLTESLVDDHGDPNVGTG